MPPFVRRRDVRHEAGGTSGAESYGRLADYKAAVINGVAGLNRIPGSPISAMATATCPPAASHTGSHAASPARVRHAPSEKRGHSVRIRRRGGRGRCRNWSMFTFLTRHFYKDGLPAHPPGMTKQKIKPNQARRSDRKSFKRMILFTFN